MPLKPLLLNNSPDFWPQLKAMTSQARDFEELFLLSSWRKKAHARKLAPLAPPKQAVRLAIMGGCSLYPLHDLLEHLCEIQEIQVELWLGWATMTIMCLRSWMKVVNYMLLRPKSSCCCPPKTAASILEA